MTIPTNYPKVTTWDAALHMAYDAAMAAYPNEDDHIRRGVYIAQQRNTVELNGHTARVLSSDGQTWYECNGTCTCKDQNAPGDRCKHRFAVALTRKAEGFSATFADPWHQWAAHVDSTSGVLHAEARHHNLPAGRTFFVPYGDHWGHWVLPEEYVLGGCVALLETMPDVAPVPDTCPCTLNNLCPACYDKMMAHYYEQDEAYPEAS